MTISEQLERAREVRGWTVTEASERTGVSIGDIVLIETGVPGVPIELLQQLSDGLQMTFYIGDTAI
ncbi:helix-turn-helix domain-containing protein [Alkalicoccus urumqiensis]|uniref:HTH cro/C1-type domain-containing protein n=1 Tax=Alkalicoccus urumqiensis TaxID=1548213 RepID=A0A2P6MIV2_ALKUR|nr:helix-turn-helix transcriptional regulator [Alkalicoccus urumqiensis]PRO66215.1 hypothetical protein C6I21_05275 [Alkalicoccus urumqiensis]